MRPFRGWPMSRRSMKVSIFQAFSSIFVPGFRGPTQMSFRELTQMLFSGCSPTSWPDAAEAGELLSDHHYPTNQPLHPVHRQGEGEAWAQVAARCSRGSVNIRMCLKWKQYWKYSPFVSLALNFVAIDLQFFFCFLQVSGAEWAPWRPHRNNAENLRGRSSQEGHGRSAKVLNLMLKNDEWIFFFIWFKNQFVEIRCRSIDEL